MVEQACISRDATGRRRPPRALFCLFVAMIACPASLAANEPTGTQIVAPRTLKVEAPGQINFDIRIVAPRGVVPSFSIVIRGLPVSIKLSAGEAIGVKRLRTVDQDRRRRVDHPLGCDDAAPRLEARSAA